MGLFDRNWQQKNADTSLIVQRDTLRVLVIDTDTRYAKYLCGVMTASQFMPPDMIDDIAKAYTFLKHNPKQYDLIIIGTQIDDTNLMTSLRDFDSNQAAVLVLVPGLDVKTIRRVYTAIQSIVDCAEKTHDKRTLKRILDNMVVLINNKRYANDNPLAFL